MDDFEISPIGEPILVTIRHRPSQKWCRITRRSKPADWLIYTLVPVPDGSRLPRAYVDLIEALGIENIDLEAPYVFLRLHTADTLAEAEAWVRAELVGLDLPAQARAEIERQWRESEPDSQTPLV